ncbi:MAG TPA: 3'-5' exonuclease, partial [Desulfurivibrionaceae bacterium]|nr:3'-5' exonuclease [Desulfurivibrionaceae bacterium]
RAALSTRFLAVESRELDLFRQETVSDAWYERFRVYHELWESAGFTRMFGEFLDREGVRERLLALPGGERALTNVLHLQEVLHAAAAGQRLGMIGLLKYLNDLIAAADDSPAEELQLRLASDAELVQIVTIHKAKGLQYPVVFCPFSWEGSSLLGREKWGGAGAMRRYLFHEQAEQEYRLVLDLGSAEQAVSREQALREELAESLRLLYVALTRAINRCYLFWGPFASAGNSAAAYLLHGARAASGGDTHAWENDLLAGLDDTAILFDLSELSRQSGGTLQLESMGEVPNFQPVRQNAGETPLNRRVFRGEFRDDWRIESFSSLHRSRDGGLAQQSSGLFEGRERGREENGDYFSDLANFPAGPGPGTFLHGLLEEMDFAGGGPERAGFLRQKLTVAGFDPRWAPVLGEMLDDLLQTPLTPADPTLTLARVGKNERCNELEFYFPLAAADPGRLESLLAAASTGLAAHRSPGLADGRPEPLRGM